MSRPEDQKDVRFDYSGSWKVARIVDNNAARELAGEQVRDAHRLLRRAAENLGPTTEGIRARQLVVEVNGLAQALTRGRQ